MGAQPSGIMGAGLMTVYTVGAGSEVQLLGAGGVRLRLAGAGAMRLRPMSASTSPAQSNHTGTCSTGWTIVRFVGDGAGSTVTPSLLSVLLSHPLSLSTPGCSSSCSFAVFEFAVVVGIGVDEEMMWRVFATRSSRSGVIVS